MPTTFDCTTAPAAPSAAPVVLSYAQARARLVQTLIARYDRPQIVYRLRMVGYDRSLDDTLSTRSLAHKLAWALLPAGPDRVKGGRA